VKIAVYDRFWPTAGGGEKFAAGIAEVLSGEHQVSLVAHEPLDLDELGEKLQLDLSAVAVEQVSTSPGSVSRASEHFDLLINASFTSADECGARFGIYVVHFPQEPYQPASWQASISRRMAPRVNLPGVRIEHHAGWHPEESVGRRRVRWTDGDAELAVHAPPGVEVPVIVTVARMQPREVPEVPLEIDVDGEVVTSATVRRTESRTDRVMQPIRFTVIGHDDGSPTRVRVRSSTFAPAELLGVDDDRQLGVAVAGVAAGDAWRAWMVRRFPHLTHRPGPPDWLQSYDRVVSNSEYTREFVRRWWRVDGGLLNPPVTLQPRGEKEPIILSVGRFFDAQGGHSKKQLEMVKAFRQLVGRGLTGWTLHFVGGCGPADQVYLERVRHQAGGLPVEFHVGASGAELRDLYGRASVYWHATGYGENPNSHPDRFEYFGITTVEAMSAGAVPVVIGHAGQLEVVTDGVEGYHWQSLDQLVSLTERVVSDEALRVALSEAAERRAVDFAMPAFADRVSELVDRVVTSVEGEASRAS
jgi:glycosyltransferase involved in cell wall biosynthesis